MKSTVTGLKTSYKHACTPPQVWKFSNKAFCNNFVCQLIIKQCSAPSWTYKNSKDSSCTANDVPDLVTNTQQHYSFFWTTIVIWQYRYKTHKHRWLSVSIMFLRYH
jgi:hypothetical protein